MFSTDNSNGSYIFQSLNYVEVTLKPQFLIKSNYCTAKFEAAAYFLQLSQNMTSDCLFTYVFSPFLPEFTCFASKIVLNIKNRRKQVNSFKNGENTQKFKKTISCQVLA